MNLFSIKDQRPVNLDNVSTIYVDYDKVIFHFNNPRSLKSGVQVPDYLYWNIGENEAQVYEDIIVSKLSEDWLLPVLSEQRYINMNNVSSIGFDDRKSKVIFNFNFSISHPHYDESLIAAYEFWEFGDDITTYTETKQNLQGES